MLMPFTRFMSILQASCVDDDCHCMQQHAWQIAQRQLLLVSCCWKLTFVPVEKTTYHFQNGIWMNSPSSSHDLVGLLLASVDAPSLQA